MTRSGVLLSAFIASLPIAFQVPDSTVSAPATGTERSERGDTRVTIATGSGLYGIVERGCEGEVLSATRVRYVDVGGEVEHRFSGPVTVGVRGGVIHESGRTEGASISQPISGSRNNTYVNPYLRLDGSWFGIGGGPLFSDEAFVHPANGPNSEDLFVVSGAKYFRPRFSAGMRLGSFDGASLRISWMEEVPALSGGNYLTAGIQTAIGRRADLFLGTSAGGPDDGGAVQLGGRWAFSPSLSVQMRGRLGSWQVVDQNGFAAGLTYRFPSLTRATDSPRSR